jgi:hypothetical protein
MKVVNTITGIIALFILFSLSCDENPFGEHIEDNKECPPINIVPTPPYNSPIWHPSGKFIGFNYTPLDSIIYPYGEECYGIQHFKYDSTGFWLVNIDGKYKRRILKYQLQTPAWNSNGEWIAFVLDGNIYKMPFDILEEKFDTTQLQQLTFEGRNFFPSWSPDGEWIAFDSNKDSPNGGYRIWCMNNVGNNRNILVEGRMPSWAQNGKCVYYIGMHNEIFKVNPENFNETIQITTINEKDIYKSDNRYPISNNKSDIIAFWSNSNLWLVDTTAVNLEKITEKNIDVDFGIPFSWAPNSIQIVFTEYYSNDWSYENGTIWVIDVNDLSEYQLTFNVKGR